MFKIFRRNNKKLNQSIPRADFGGIDGVAGAPQLTFSDRAPLSSLAIERVRLARGISYRMLNALAGAIWPGSTSPSLVIWLWIFTLIGLPLLGVWQNSTGVPFIASSLRDTENSVLVLTAGEPNAAADEFDAAHRQCVDDGGERLPLRPYLSPFNLSDCPAVNAASPCQVD